MTLAMSVQKAIWYGRPIPKAILVFSTFEEYLHKKVPTSRVFVVHSIPESASSTLSILSHFVVGEATGP